MSDERDVAYQSWLNGGSPPRDDSTPLGTEEEARARRKDAWPEAVHNLACELWYSVCGRDMGRLSKLTGSGEYEVFAAYIPDGIHTATLHTWCRREQWADVANARLRAFAPTTYDRVLDKAIFAADLAIDGVIAAVPLSAPEVPTSRVQLWRLALESGGIIGQRAAAAISPDPTRPRIPRPTAGDPRLEEVGSPRALPAGEAIRLLDRIRELDSEVTTLAADMLDSAHPGGPEPVVSR